MNKTTFLIRTSLLMCAITLAASPVAAQRLQIGQVDTGRLLIGQRVDLYLSIDTPNDGEPTLDDFTVAESADGTAFSPVSDVFDLRAVRNLDAPLSFAMLIDNSGSMYDETVPGEPDVRRIDAARTAIREFANGITNSRDRIGLAVFNTRYRLISSPTSDKASVGDLLDGIEKPAREEAYTELYAALVQAASHAASVGRRTVVVLSDGENYPYSVYEKKDNPVYGPRLYTYQDAIDAFQREGLSLFAIHYGSREDPNLAAIADATGGAVYRARGAAELAQVYRDIRERLLSEYRLSYRAGMIAGDRRFVRVTYSGAGRDLVAIRPYFANTLFAGSGSVPPVVFGIVFVLGLILLGVLLVVSVRASQTGSSLVVIDSGGAKGLEKTIVLGSGDTVIGASPDADVTIAGVPAISERHAVVQYKEKKNEYTIVSDVPVRVNNNPVTKRVLKPGDVVNIEGTIFAYDGGEKTEDS